jgi:ribosome-associated protein
MKTEIIKYASLDSEVDFSYSRSSGPGGQSVNKVNSRVELRFNVSESKILTEDQKHTVLIKLKSRINNDGILHLSGQEDRSQLRNKEKVIERFYKLINKALKLHKKRVKTKPSRLSIEKRLKSKKETSEKKQRRRNDFN